MTIGARWRRWLNRTEIPPSVQSLLFAITYAIGIAYGYGSKQSLMATILVGAATAFLASYVIRRLLDDEKKEADIEQQEPTPMED